MKESSICVKLDLIPEKKSYSDCGSFRNHGLQHKNRRPHKQKIKEENYESCPDVLSGLFFVFIKCGVFMALSWRVNQPLIIVKYNYKNKGGLRYAVW